MLVITGNMQIPSGPVDESYMLPHEAGVTTCFHCVGQRLATAVRSQVLA